MLFGRHRLVKDTPLTGHAPNRGQTACRLVALAVLAALLACQVPAPATPTPNPATPTPQPPTPTAIPDAVRLIREEGFTDDAFEAFVLSLQSLTNESGLRLELAAPNASPIVPSDTRILISYGSAVAASPLAQANPRVQVVAIGSELEPAPNLIVIGPQGFRWDQQGFVAGYAAALATPGFRVGVVSLQDLPQSRPAASGFVQGAVFYCGLCNPAQPPFLDYPLQFSASTQESEMAAAASALQSADVRAVYLPDRAASLALAPLVTNGGMLLLGPALPDESLRPSWLVSIRADPASALRLAWPDLLAGKASGSLPMPLLVGDAHPAWLTPGKLALLEDLVTALSQGAVATGVDPSTGEPENTSGG
jgi:hypothetical protein